MNDPTENYHPLMVQLWKEVLGTDDDRYALPLQSEKAAEIALRKLDPRELDWLNTSFLNAAVVAQELDADQVKDALVRLSELTERLIELHREAGDSFARSR